MSKVRLLKVLKAVIFVFLCVSDCVFSDDNNENLDAYNINGDNLQYNSPSKEESYFADPAPMASNLRMYVGLNAGGSLSKFKSTITKDSNSQSISNNFGSYLFNICAGLGINLRHFYIAGELSSGYNSLKRTISAKDLSSSLVIKNRFPAVIGFDIIPGIITRDRSLLLYGRAGIGVSWFDFCLDKESESKFKKFDICKRIGLGSEYFFSDMMSCRLDYIYSIYNNIQHKYTAEDGKNNSYSFKSSNQHQLTLGLNFNF